METHLKLLIKEINKPYNTEIALKNVLRYIVREKENEKGKEVRYWKAFGASGHNINKVIKQFIQIQKLYGKNNRKRIRHFLIAFPLYMDDPNIARLTAEAVSEFIYEEYQIVYAVHEKKDNLHVHFALNPVSYKTQKKWHKSKAEFMEWKKEIHKIVNQCFIENGYEVCKM